MKNFILIFIISFLVGSCSDKCFELTKYDYTLEIENGLYVEKFDPEITDENRYNSNNNIYKICKEFIYDYYYEDTDGNQMLFEREKGDNSNIDRSKWFFVPKDDTNKRTVVQMNKTVSSGLDPFTDFNPDYNQTVIKFSDVQKRGKCITRETTGLIENEMNIWTHPPRQGLFAMLEFAPFPFIQAPYEIGNTWVFDYIRINGENWSDPRWLEFEGQINIVSTYEITDIKNIETAFGSLECYEISGVATNPYGDAELVAYFNFEYGFVKLNYTNINDSKLVMELVEVKD